MGSKDNDGQRLSLVTHNLESLRAAGALESIVDLFLDTVPRQLAQMQDALARDDFPELGRIVHQLKGSSGYVGGREMHRLSRELHEAVLRNGGKGCTRLLVEIETEHARLEAELRAFLASGVMEQ